MSRSFKKVVGYKDNNNKVYKKHSNKVARKDMELQDGMQYKRNDLSWDICDWKIMLHTDTDIIKWITRSRPFFRPLHKLYTK